MNILANQEKIGTSKFDLYLFKALYRLSFKKSTCMKKQVEKIEDDLETIKNRKLF